MASKGEGGTPTDPADERGDPDRVDVVRCRLPPGVSPADVGLVAAVWAVPAGEGDLAAEEVRHLLSRQRRLRLTAVLVVVVAVLGLAWWFDRLLVGAVAAAATVAFDRLTRPSYRSVNVEVVGTDLDAERARDHYEVEA